MSTVVSVFVVSLAGRWVYLLMEWVQARTERRMLRAVARIKQAHKARSRRGSGSEQPGQPILLSGSGVAERPTTPPPRPADTAVPPRPRVRRAPTPVGACPQHQDAPAGRVGVEHPVALAPPTHLALVGAALPHLAASTRPSPQHSAGAGSTASAPASAELQHSRR